jgi:hypothetical protein
MIATRSRLHDDIWRETMLQFVVFKEFALALRGVGRCTRRTN